MAEIYGDIVQSVIYFEYIDTYTEEGLIALMQAYGLTPSTARDTARFMRNYWNQVETTAARPGRQWFEPMLQDLIFKDAAIEPTGDYSYLDSYPFVMGEEALEAVLDNNPEYMLIVSSLGQNLFRVGDGIVQISRGVSLFIYGDDANWRSYIGASDSELSLVVTEG